jgi:hypothetical protein
MLGNCRKGDENIDPAGSEPLTFPSIPRKTSGASHLSISSPRLNISQTGQFLCPPQPLSLLLTPLPTTYKLLISYPYFFDP